MKKGRFGIVYAFYVVIAFIGVILKMPLLSGLVFGVALLAEREENISRRCLEAFLLSLVSAFLVTIFSWLGGFAASLFFFFATPLSVLCTGLSALVYAAAVVLSIMAIIRAGRDGEPDVPFFSDLAYMAFGSRKPKAVPPTAPPPFSGEYPQGRPGPGPSQGQYPQGQPPQSQPPQGQAPNQSPYQPHDPRDGQ